MIAVATDIGDKINRELRSYGANLLVTPQQDTLDVEIGGVDLKPPGDGAFLNEADLPRSKAHSGATTSWAFPHSSRPRPDRLCGFLHARVKCSGPISPNP